MFDKDINQITEEGLQSLIDDEVPESKKLDYKEILPGNSHDNKKEFLKDVSAFANTSGGLLIYGISEDSENGIPEELKGLDITNPDDEISRLENIIRNGIEPKISPIEMKPIRLSDSGKFIILVKVPKSWRSPHRVSLNGHNKFYLRISNTNHEMDVSELRTAFNLSETLTERIRRFREDRLSNIVADETPVPLEQGAKMVLHIIPINSFNPSQNYEIDKIYSDTFRLRPIYNSPQIPIYNIDGILSHSMLDEGKSESYVQLFRNGIIEASTTSLIDNKNKKITDGFHEEQLIKFLDLYLNILQELGVESPIFVFLTIIGVKGFKMWEDPHSFRNKRNNPIDRDLLLLPEYIIENYESKPEKILKTSFDSIWNACGYPGSPNYNDEDEWIPEPE